MCVSRLPPVPPSSIWLACLPLVHPDFLIVVLQCSTPGSRRFLLPTPVRHGSWRLLPASVKRQAGSVTVRCSPRRHDSPLLLQLARLSSDPCLTNAAVGLGLTLQETCHILLPIHSHPGPDEPYNPSGKQQHYRCPLVWLSGVSAHPLGDVCPFRFPGHDCQTVRTTRIGKASLTRPSLISSSLLHGAVYHVVQRSPSTVQSMSCHQLSRSSLCTVLLSPLCLIRRPRAFLLQAFASVSAPISRVLSRRSYRTTRRRKTSVKVTDTTPIWSSSVRTI